MADQSNPLPPTGLPPEYWDPVLCYAELCAISPEDAVQLATEAVSDDPGAVWLAAVGREDLPLPWTVPLLMRVGRVVAQWYEQGHEDRLQPELRTCLDAEGEARDEDGVWSGARRRPFPLALRGLLSMPEQERALLWHTQVESQPVEVTAALLDATPEHVTRESERVREVFRARCLRVHTDAPGAELCRAYVRMLEAATRRPRAVIPEDLRDHLADCPTCGAAARCLTPHSYALPEELATAVLGWGGPAYLERRRATATEPGGTGTSRDAASATRGPSPHTSALPPDGRGAGGRRFALAGALTVLIVGVLATVLAVLPGSSPPQDTGAVREAASDRNGRLPAPPPDTGPGTPGPAGLLHGTPSPGRSKDPEGDKKPARTTPPATPSSSATPSPDPDPEPGSSSPRPSHSDSDPAPCTARFKLVNEWPDGFQAEVTLASRTAVNRWRATWTYRDGQRVTQMWNASHRQRGTKVMATAADYNTAIPAGGSVTIGYLGTWQGRNSPPTDFTLNGHRCSVSTDRR